MKPHRLILMICFVVGGGLCSCEKLAYNGLDDVTAEVSDSGDAKTDDASSNFVFVGHRLILGREDPEGVSIGFNLDGVVSGANDADGCRQADFVSETGEVGIDNQLARLLPLIEDSGGAALNGLVQSAVNEGDMLIMVELDDLDSRVDDDHVVLRITRGIGKPYIGTDGFIEPSQTFDIDLAAPSTEFESVVLRDGVIEGGPFEFELPIFVFDFEFLITAKDARVRIEFQEDGSLRGLLGGEVSIDNMLEITENIDGGRPISILIEGVGRGLADLNPSDRGVCDSLSVAAEFATKPAFFYSDTARPTYALVPKTE